MGAMIALVLFILVCLVILLPGGGSPKRRLINVLSQCIDQAVIVCGVLTGKYRGMEVKCDPEYVPGGAGADLCQFVFIKMEIPPNTDIANDPGRFMPGEPGIFRDSCFLVYPFAKQKLLIRETALIALEELYAGINGNEPGYRTNEDAIGQEPGMGISCQNCGHEIAAEEDKCPSCGWTWNIPASADDQPGERQAEFPICANCGELFGPDEAFCGKCGNARKKNPLEM
jgi:hypothetical protein